MMADKFAHHFIMIARHVNNARAVSGFVHDHAQYFVVRRGPNELAAQSPEIDNIAEQIKRFAIDAAQKIEQILRAAIFTAKMNIGQPHCSHRQTTGVQGCGHFDFSTRHFYQASARALPIVELIAKVL
jgi:hypothetical protein